MITPGSATTDSAKHYLTKDYLMFSDTESQSDSSNTACDSAIASAQTMNKSHVKRRNTLGGLNHYTLPDRKYTGGECRLWNNWNDSKWSLYLLVDNPDFDIWLWHQSQVDWFIRKQIWFKIRNAIEA